MSYFPNWIEEEGGTILFVTDSILKEHSIDLRDGIDYDAIHQVFPKAKGVKGLGFPCPPEIVKAIRAGKMKGMMQVCNYQEIHLNEEGNLHSDDGPAVICLNGRKEWHQNGKPHRDNGPAIIWSNGTLVWWKDGRIHRDGGPATIFPDGTEQWYKNGDVHRDDGPARSCPDGTKYWYKKGVLIAKQKKGTKKETTFKGIMSLR